jgi:acetoin utilization deacetylase AcuC-like enzyme
MPLPTSTKSGGEPRSGIHLDPDTALNPSSLQAARHAAGAVVLGTDLVMSGECSAAPSVPSARPDITQHANGRWAFACSTTSPWVSRTRRQHGPDPRGGDRLDVHHGNGTGDIFAGDQNVIMVGTFQYPLYPYSGVEPLGANMHNVPLSPGSGTTRSAPRLPAAAFPLEHEPEILFVSPDSMRIARIRWRT